MPTLEWDFRHTPYYRICSHIGTQKTRTSVSKSAFCGPEKTVSNRNYMQKPTRVYRHAHTYDRYTQVWIHP